MIPRKKIKSNPTRWEQGEVEERDSFDLTQPGFAPNFFRPSVAGVPVTSVSALGIAAFAQGTKLISESIAKTDLFPARRHPGGGYLPATDLAVYDVVRHAPNDYQTSFTFWATLVTHILVAGLGLAEIKRTFGRVTGLHLLDPSFKPAVHHDRLVYKSGSKTLDAADVICLRGISWTGLDAFSPVDLSRDMLGTRIAETQYQAGMLGNGAVANGHLELPGNTSEQQRAQIRKDWNAGHQGPAQAGNLGILWNGAKWVQTSYSPADTQLIQSQNFGVAEVSRLLNIPGWMLGVPDAIKPSSTEEGSALFVSMTLSSWFRQIQQELDLKLLSREERQDIYFWHDTRKLTQGDSRSQVDEAERLSKSGIYSLNEARLSLGMNPIDDERFNHHYIGTNNQQAVETIQPGVPTQPGVNQPKPPANVAQAMRVLLADPINRMLRVEAEGIRRIGKRDRFDTAAGDFYGKHANKLAEALAPALEATNLMLGTAFDARAIAQSIAEGALGELRSLWMTYPPDDLAAQVESLTARWESDRAATLVAHLLEDGSRGC